METLKLSGANHAECPACGLPRSILCKEPDRTGLWQHYFSKKCKSFRNQNPGNYPNGVDLMPMIRSAYNGSRKLQREALAVQKASDRAYKLEMEARKHRKHDLSGAFILDIIEELEGALYMMEPYYSQCRADSSGREMVSKLEAIVASCQK